MKEYRNILMTILSILILLAVSCSNEGTTGGGGEGGGAGGGAGGGSGGQGGSGYPSWYLTEAQQQQNFSMGPTTVFESQKREVGQQYRIPSIIVADNGNIVALADDRKTHGGDIGDGKGLVDPSYRISKDGGKTWSAIKPILPLSSDKALNVAKNKGDSLIFKANDGTLVVLAVSGGGWFGAQDTSPSRIVRSESKDHGETWTGWQEVGENIFTELRAKYGKPKAFAASGRGLTLQNGAFVAAMLAQRGNGNHYVAYIYSGDQGKTWKLGDGIVHNFNNSVSGDKLNEPKVIAELDDGKLLMSIRNQKASVGSPNNGGNRFYAISSGIPNDEGNVTWPENVDKFSWICGNVDAEGVIWTRKSVTDRSRLIHIQAGPTYRKGLKLFVLDVGNSTISPPYKEYMILSTSSATDEACYSSIDVLGDGTIVTLTEEYSPANGYYDIVFRRYNMKIITGEVYKTEWYKPIKN